MQWAKIGVLHAMHFDKRSLIVEHLEVICDFANTLQCHKLRKVKFLNCDRVVDDAQRAPLLDKFG